MPRPRHHAQMIQMGSAAEGDDSHPIRHLVEEIIDGNELRIAVKEIGDHEPALVTSRHPAVLGHVQRVQAARRATAYASRPITSIPKKRRSPVVLVACPQCSEDGIDWCSLCRGKGAVSEKAAQAWYAERISNEH